MTSRVGVDVGGTFTDMVYFDEIGGTLKATKIPSTPHAPEEAVATAFQGGVATASVESVEYFMHGTTVALNALIERKGAKVGLVTTAGFRDVLEIRRGERGSITDLHWRPSPLLVPRVRRREARERISAGGLIETEIVAQDVVDAALAFVELGVEAIAVCFINAYANPTHERRAAELIRQQGFEGELSLSHTISGEYREYERFSTTVVDAYVRPRLAGYFGGLAEQLAGARFHGRTLVTTSGGGSVDFDEARERPFETIQSGTAAGAVGAAALCADLGIPLALAADVGGTSFDAALIVDHRPMIKHEGRVLGMPIQTAWVDVRSIGAGGGSIATVDSAGAPHVGPGSAGAVPGPACYRRGGRVPTATDAAAALGMLGRGKLASGFDLDLSAARSVMEELGRELGLSWTDAARGTLTILTANMAGLIKEISAEYGQDVRSAQLLAFGGSGPLLGTLLCRELEAAGIVVPNFAGNFSAWALLSQDVVQTSSLTWLSKLDDDGVVAANEKLHYLHRQLSERSSGFKKSTDVSRNLVELDLRYVGQEYCLTIPAQVDGATITDSAQQLRAKFEDEYRRTFKSILDHDVEITAIRGSVQTMIPRIEHRFRSSLRQEPPVENVDCFSFAAGKVIPFELRAREYLMPGELIAKPTIVTEETTTTLIDADFVAKIHPTGALLLTPK